MEYVLVKFPTDRFVYVDGEKGGKTNKVLRVETGSHEFDLGSLGNYTPASIEADVKNTTVLGPLVVVFTRK